MVWSTGGGESGGGGGERLYIGKITTVHFGVVRGLDSGAQVRLRGTGGGAKIRHPWSFIPRALAVTVIGEKVELSH